MPNSDHDAQFVGELLPDSTGVCRTTMVGSTHVLDLATS